MNVIIHEMVSVSVLCRVVFGFTLVVKVGISCVKVWICSDFATVLACMQQLIYHYCYHQWWLRHTREQEDRML